MREIYTDKKLTILISVLLIVVTLFPLFNAQNIDHYKENGDNQRNQTSSDYAIVYLKKYDTQSRQYIQEPICTLTRNEAEQLKDELFQVEKKCNSNIEKIGQQFSILHKWEIIPSFITLENLLYIKEKIDGSVSLPRSTYAFTPHTIYCGPSLTSFLTIGGSFFVLHQFLGNLLPPYLYTYIYERLDMFNGTRLAGWLGITPVLGMYCPVMTLINAFGLVEGPNTVFSPFMALMVLYVGFGIAVSVFDDGYPYSLFDWGVGVSLTGVIIYIMEQTQT